MVHGTYSGSVEGKQYSLRRYESTTEDASDQQRITFFPNQASALAEFSAGRLDWISCSSTNLPRLRKSLGASRGVSNLPSGPGGSASPINRLRVLALGRNSSRQGRDRALAFSRFSVNPLVQRGMTLGSQILLPANRFVKVPVQSSQRLAALVTAAKDSAQTANLAAMLHSRDPRLPRIKRLLSELVFGDLPERQASRQVLAILGQSR